jgi:hypothetical protein
MAQYRVNKTTSIFKENPNKKDMFGDIGTDVVGTLQTGAIIEIANVGSGGRGVVATPYLFFADGTYIIGYDADKYVSPFGDISKLLNASPDYRLDPPSKPINNDLLNKQYQDAKNQQNALSQQNNLTSKYVFSQDFEATTRIVDNTPKLSENVVYIELKYKFKKGDIFEGKKIPVNAGANPDAKKYDIQITTPESIKSDGSVYKGQVTYQVDDSLVSEATFLQKHKNHLLILGALVLGYLAYKKFNK